MSPKTIPDNLGKKLKMIRKKNGYTLDAMAEKLGMEGISRRSRVYEWEIGTRQPDLKILLQYARMADVSTDELIDDEQKLNI